jgi:hypothetical protein
MSGCLVMLSVADLPRKVRNQERRVDNPANSVIHNLGVRERLMTTFVSQNPESSAKETLQEGVDTPQSTAGIHVRDVFWRSIGVSQVESRGQQQHVTEDIS